MAENKDEIPEYLKEIKARGPLKLDDRFGPEDVVWIGEDGELDPDELIAQEGREYRSPLFQVVRALVAGHQSKLPQHELEAKVRTVCDEIIGNSNPGRSDVDDGPLLLEIAHRYHETLHAAGKWPGGSVPVKPIVREVVLEHGKTHRQNRMPAEVSLVRTLVNKFNKDKDLWLSRATTEGRYYNPSRMHDINRLRTGLRMLADAGVSLDISQVGPTTRPNDPGDKTR